MRFRRRLPLLVVLCTLAPSAASAASLKILPLGDESTIGKPAVPGYRKYLYDRLLADGHAVDMVGTQEDPGSPWAERQHEGHEGFTPAQLSNVVSSGVIAGLKPDVVLLLAGMLAITTPADVEQGPKFAAGTLQQLIEDLTTQRPEAWVLVGNLPQSPSGCPEGKYFFESFVVRYNDLLPGIVDAIAAKGRKVALVDLHRPIGCGSVCNADRSVCTSPNMSDNQHPSDAGYRVIANVWYQAISELIAGKLMPGDETGIDASAPTGTTTVGVPAGKDAGAPVVDPPRPGGFGGSTTFPTVAGSAGTASVAGSSGSGGRGGAAGTTAQPGDESGCACAVGRTGTTHGAALLLAALVGVVVCRRRRG